MIKSCILHTPIGYLQCYANSKTLLKITFTTKPNIPQLPTTHPILQECVRQIVEYFHSNRTSFHLPLSLNALSPFSQAVLHEIAKIPYGMVMSYQQIAKNLNNPKASRAIGNASAKNPYPLIIPCHRVIKTNRQIGGYLGQKDSPIKAYLLDFERQTNHSLLMGLSMPSC